MAAEKQSWLSSIISIIKYTVVAFLFWFVIAAGWNGWYIAYHKKILGKPADDHSGERFGNKVFLFWLLLFLGGVYWFEGRSSDDATAFLIFLWTNLIFFGMSVIGLTYFFDDLP